MRESLGPIPHAASRTRKDANYAACTSKRRSVLFLLTASFSDRNTGVVKEVGWESLGCFRKADEVPPSAAESKWGFLGAGWSKSHELILDSQIMDVPISKDQRELPRLLQDDHPNGYTCLQKPSILVFCDWFLPGFRAGGPVRAIANMVEQLGDEFAFSIVTRDRDCGGAIYDCVIPDRWHRLGKACVFYRNRAPIPHILRRAKCDLIYLNSFFSWSFSIQVVWHLGLIGPRRVPILLAPRGELSPHAMSLKKFRKTAYARVARQVGVYRRIKWQATSIHEASDIRDNFPSAIVCEVPDIPAAVVSEPSSSAKVQGRVRLFYLGRIARIKNLHIVLSSLPTVRGSVELTICGPVEDNEYWEHCLSHISRLPPNVKVHYLGMLEPGRIQHVLAKQDLMILPTSGENFCHAIFEALAAGCPVLVSDRTPWRNLEQKGIGWDLPLGNIDAFRDIIQHVVDMGELAHSEMRKRSRAFAREWIRNSDAINLTRRMFLGVIAAAC